MRNRVLAVTLAIATLIAFSSPVAATHNDPHLGNSIDARPNPNSHNSTYTYYIEVCLSQSVFGGPVWDAYGAGFLAQDRIRDAMAAWNALNGEAHLFVSDNCATTDTYILVSNDTYSMFAVFQYSETKSCATGTCWETAILHFSTAVSWYMGTATTNFGGYDGWSMFTHELGHGFNLGHATAGSLATMEASLGLGATFMRSLKGGPCGSTATSDVFGYRNYFGCTH